MSVLENAKRTFKKKKKKKKKKRKKEKIRVKILFRCKLNIFLGKKTFFGGRRFSDRYIEGKKKKKKKKPSLQLSPFRGSKERENFLLMSLGVMERTIKTPS